MTDDRTPAEPAGDEGSENRRGDRPPTSEEMIRQAREDVYDDDPLEGFVPPTRSFDTEEADADAPSTAPTADPAAEVWAQPAPRQSEPNVFPAPPAGATPTGPVDARRYGLGDEAPRGSVWGKVIGFLVLAGLVALGWWLFSNLGDDDADVMSLEPGDCFLGFDGDQVASVDIVECAEPHIYEVFHNEVFPDGPYPGAAEVDEEGHAGCLAEFEAFVGLPYAESEWIVTTLVPLEENWPEDRTVNCLLVRADPDDPTVPATVTGSAQDSGV